MIEFKEGDIFTKNEDSEKIVCIAHQCNALGVMGAGLAKQVKTRYPEAYNLYHARTSSGLAELGDSVMVKVDDKTNGIMYIANLIGQYGYGTDRVQTDYSMLEIAINDMCWWLINSDSKAYKEGRMVIRFPYLMGCGLAGGDWDKVFSLIETHFRAYNIFDNFNIEIWRKDK